ncbi:hypothetical protein KFK09_007260 [Dendrobium nobile]|uniref:Reverse transcriptase domain-containing protein n=1 Tax=Dendrobium nobile TaxID=94219 RepID=A0A8T3BTU9_DENNO|nr:hypothetical protein KFK09_007260 [Dendrobium nobile]
MHKEWKDTLIVLIPKVKNPNIPSNFWPISLCQTTYKIVATMLVNRLKKIIPKLISEEQMAFIPSRSMSEHCLLAQEIFNKFKTSKNKKGFMVVKLDMEQAYDSMGWPTLLQVLNWFGFPSILSGFLMEYVVDVRFSIILNGKMLNWIRACSGFRWTGQNVNINKSQILFGKAVRRQHKRKVAEILGFKVVKEWKYLGIKISLRRLKIADFHDFLNQVMDKLNMCRNLHYVPWSENCKPRTVGGLGVQSLAIRTWTLRARLAWNWVQNPYTLLHRRITVKNIVGVLDGICKSNASNALRILIDGGIKLKNIVRWRLINADGIWDEVKLKMFFHEDLILLIKQVQIDAVSLETISKFSGKSLSALAYEFIINNRDLNDDGGFSIWLKNIKLNSKVELFWWRLSKFAIPTNHFLKFRRIADDDYCARGCQEVENYEHIVVRCKYLNEVVTTIQRWGFAIPKFYSLDECLEEMKKISARNKSTVRLYCTAIFLSWKNRNLVKHGGTAMSSSMVAANTISLSTFKSNLYLDSWGTNLSRESSTTWYPPLLDWIKINVDASWLPSCRAGIAGIFRDYKGRILVAFGKNTCDWDISQVELEAIFTIRDYIQNWMLESKGVIVESDNINVIKHIQNSLKKVEWQMENYPIQELLFLKDSIKLFFILSIEIVTEWQIFVLLWH